MNTLKTVLQPEYNWEYFEVLNRELKQTKRVKKVKKSK